MKKINFKISKLGDFKRLDQIISNHEVSQRESLSRSLIRKLIVAGAVYVNHKRVRIASKELRGGENIEIYLDEKKMIQKMEEKDWRPLRVVYEDDAVICFDKPAGLPTQPTLDESRINLYELAKKQLQELAVKPIYLGMHHRLDRDTSGVILFTRDKKYNAFVADLFSGHKISKLYVAVVHGHLEQKKGRLESYLSEVGKRGKQKRFGSVQSGGKKAITDFLVLSSNEQQSLVEVSITTGRTHQIRVHLSEMGHPIVGDTLYGSPPQNYENKKRHLLHAHAMTFEHPESKNLVRVESPIPPEFRF